MNLVDLSEGIEIIPSEECRELLREERVGRLAVVIDGRPEIFPVNYGIDGDGILFRSNPGLKLTGALSGEVAFEVDHIDAEARSGWSVVIHGRARDVTHFDGPGLHARADEPWPGPKSALVRIAPDATTGRRVTGAAGAIRTGAARGAAGGAAGELVGGAAGEPEGGAAGEAAGEAAGGAADQEAGGGAPGEPVGGAAGEPHGGVDGPATPPP